MHFTVPIYQRRRGTQIHWTTLGLGPHTAERSGRNAHKLRQRLIGELRATALKLEGRQLEWFLAARGLRLERVRLDLAIRAAGGKRRFTGRFPLILQPRRTGSAETIYLAYHPHRQEEWFPLAAGEDPMRKAALYFQRAWHELDDAQIEQLKTNGKDRLKVVAFSLTPRSLLARLPDHESSIWDDLEPSLFKGEKRQKSGSMKALPQIGVDLTQQAASEALPLGMPREPYRQQLRLLLSGRQRRPLVVVGPAQVGKTTLLNRWIADLLHDEGYATHLNLDRTTHVWAIGAARIIAGMSYLGDWEQRCGELLADARSRRVILWAQDLHTFGRVGRTRDSDRTLASFFRGPLARGEVLVVGECTPAQLTRLEQDAPSFAALFSRVFVQPTTGAETLGMVVHEARQLELEHDVAYDPPAFYQLLDLADSLLSNTALPGKALDLVRALARRAAARDGANLPAEIPVGSAELLDLLASKTGLPEALLAPDQPLAPAAIRERFAQRIIGQPAALDAATDLVARIRSGLTDPRRPYAVYLFTGPTGTGKTELAKCITEYLYGDLSRLLRLDMGEYSGTDATARLVGDSYQPRGLLTERVRQQPFCVILLDEIEKAHPSLLNLLLQLFDEGRLTDAEGNTARFNHAVLIMTSNLGVTHQAPIGFDESTELASAGVARAVRDFFPPELFNRIDRVVPFSLLSRESARLIAEKELARLIARRGLRGRNIFVYPSPQVIERVVDEGFDPVYGARTVKRYLEREVGGLLARELSRGGRALLRAFHLYSGADRGYRVHGETLANVEATQLDNLGLETLRALPARELQRRLPAALDFLDLLMSDESWERLASRIGFHLERHRAGSAADTDALFNLDSARLELRALRGRIGHMKVKKIAARQRLLAELARVYFYRRVLDGVDDPDLHAVTIDLARLGLRGEPDLRVERAAAGPLGIRARGRAAAGFRIHISYPTDFTTLLDQLVWPYLYQGFKLEAFAWRTADGAIEHGEQVESLQQALRQTPPQVLLKLTGLGVADYFGGETGCHIWRTPGQGAQAVRVEVRPGGHGQRPGALLAQQQRAAAAFREALAEGRDPLPENPQRLLPLVREYRFDPPPTPRQVREIEIADHALGVAETYRGKVLWDGLWRLWQLRMSRFVGDDDPLAAPADSDEKGG